MTVDKIIILARKHRSNPSSRLCLCTALQHKEQGQYAEAYAWALKSLKYSVGILHNDYRRAEKGAPA